MRPRMPSESDEVGTIWCCGGTYLPLHGEVAIASGNTEEECVKVDEVIREKDRVVWAWWCPDELQDVLGEGLLDSAHHVGRRNMQKVAQRLLVDRSTTASVADTGLDSLGDCTEKPLTVRGRRMHGRDVRLAMCP